MGVLLALVGILMSMDGTVKWGAGFIVEFDDMYSA